MSLPANQLIYVIGSTAYYSEPSHLDMIRAVVALCASAGHPEYLPANPQLADLESALRQLGATGSADTSRTIGTTTYIQKWSPEDILGVIRQLNG
jgi:hypothetical protein